MSFSGDNYLVPGSNPALSPVQSISGSGIALVTTPIPANYNVYVPPVVSERISMNTGILITGTTQATAQIILSMLLSLDAISNISIWANFTARTNSALARDISFFIESEINGSRAVVGYVNQNTVVGVNAYENCNLVAGTFNTPINNVTLRLKVFASVASTFVVAPAQLLAHGNISQD